MILRWHDDGWRKRFALLPIYLSDGPNKRVIWLQWVWKRFNGLWIEVRETDPRPIAIEAGTAETQQAAPFTRARAARHRP